MFPRLVGFHKPFARHRLLQQAVSGGDLTSNLVPHVGAVRLTPERGQARASGRETDWPHVSGWLAVQLLDQFWHHIKQITHNAVVRNLKNRCRLIGVDRHNRVRTLHADLVLNRS